jgi:hypothetical protein
VKTTKNYGLHKSNFSDMSGKQITDPIERLAEEIIGQQIEYK